jgi:hypothetical protein
VGGYGGYVYQDFDAKGLNQFITEFNLETYETLGVLKGINNASGYRLGLNFFRATFENNIILTAKGFYQSLGKTSSAKIENTSSYNYSLDLDIQNWALGFDVGWQFTKVVSWKIIDGSLNFNNVKLTETTDLPGETYVDKYKSDSGVFGYSIGTGIIVAIIKDYVSIEGLAGYTHLVIDDVYDEAGTKFYNPYITQLNSENKFIESGGFTAVIQLNIGFPLL